MRSLLGAAAALVVFLPQEGPGPGQQQDGAEAGPVRTPAGVDLASWEDFDLESRWVTFQTSQARAGAAAAIEDWVRFLEARRDFELLEYLAIYGGYHTLVQKSRPGEVLTRLDAPQWMRVALWNIRQGDTHSLGAIRAAFRKQPARFVGWARKHPEVARLGGAELLAEFRNIAPADPGDQLPPLDPQTLILPFLEAPRQLADFTPGAKLDPGTRYRFQVLRAIGAISIVTAFDPPYHVRLLALTRHADARVRRAAMLEFSEFPPESIPWSELLVMARMAELDEEDRRAALLSASYADRPAVYLELHAVLADPTHPTHPAALSRVSAFGNGYTAAVLRKIPRAGMDPALDRRLREVEERLRATEEGLWATQKLISLPIANLLHRAAWAVAQDHPQAAALREWTQGFLRGMAADRPEVRARLRAVQDAPGAAIPAALHEWVRAEAKTILAAK